MLSYSLLAAPLILDLVLIAELTTRITLKRDGEAQAQPFHPVAVLLSYLTKVSATSRIVHTNCGVLCTNMSF